MDIDIDIAELSAETKGLLLRFQIAHLRYLTCDGDYPGAHEWCEEYRRVRLAFAQCPEKQIADAGRKIVEASRDSLCKELDAEGEKLIEEGKLSPDDFMQWFNAQLAERCDEITELEYALHRLSLRVADRRPEFFKQIN